MKQLQAAIRRKEGMVERRDERAVSEKSEKTELKAQHKAHISALKAKIKALE